MALKIDRLERGFLYATVVVLVLFMVAIVMSVGEAGIHLPTDEGSIDPGEVDTTAPFDNPGVFEVGPGKYQAVVVAQAWFFEPAEIRVPAGSEVEFVVTSKDVLHGWMIPQTTINAMVIPGRITKVTTTFDEPGEHNIICHEFCGLGHSGMFGRLVVEER